MDKTQALDLLEKMRDEIEGREDVPPIIGRLLGPIGRVMQVRSAHASGEAPPTRGYQTRANCIHAEDTGEKFNPGKPCMGRKIICWNDALLYEQPGAVLEFGVASGKSINQIAELCAERDVYGFDSFEGLPEDWKKGGEKESFPKGAFATDSLPEVAENVRLEIGGFSETVPEWARRHSGERAAYVHIDCDLYSSTALVLNELTRQGIILPGTVITFDEIRSWRTDDHYPNWREGEFRALVEWGEMFGVDMEPVGRNDHEAATIRVLALQAVPETAMPVYSFTFAGRAKFMRILHQYLLASRGTIDKHFWCVNTTKEEDRSFVKTLCKEHPDFYEAIELADPDERYWHNYGKFYKHLTEDAIYLKFDDDIVWMAPGAAANMVAFRRENPEYLYAAFNTINNGICGHLQHRSGSFGEWVDYGADGNLRQTPELCERLHRTFLRDVEEGDFRKWVGFERFVLSRHERYSISAICFFGRDCRTYKFWTDPADEKNITCDVTRRTRRNGVIVGNALVSHFAFNCQHEYMAGTDVLNCYGRLLEGC